MGREPQESAMEAARLMSTVRGGPQAAKATIRAFAASMAAVKKQKRVTLELRRQMYLESIRATSILTNVYISSTSLSIYSWGEILRVSGDRRISGSAISTAMGSINDSRMGVVGNKDLCGTCNKVDCPGHYGRIEFGDNWIVHPMYYSTVVSILNCVCHSCGRLKLTIAVYRELGILNYPEKQRLKRVVAFSERTDCTNRGQATPVTHNQEKAEGIIIPCSRSERRRYTARGTKESGQIFYETETGARESAADKLRDPSQMPIKDVYALLSGLTKEEHEVLGVPNPENLIMQGILVIPPSSRPPTEKDGKAKADYITNIYSDIAGALNPDSSIVISETILYGLVKQLISNPKRMEKQDEDKAITDILQGKAGVLRRSAMGKRTQLSARGVLGPDSSLIFGMIGVPIAWTNVLTKPFRVHSWNIKAYQILLENGRIESVENLYGFKVPIREEDRHTYKLKEGETVKRFLWDGDRILMNRQPTLHKTSLMGYEAVITNDPSIKLHISTTTPMNADFDGDEGNLVIPQGQGVEAEARYLMAVGENIASGEQNKNCMGFVMNSVTGSYLLSMPTTTVREDIFLYGASVMSNKRYLKSLPRRLMKHGVPMLSGRAYFSMLLPEDFNYIHGELDEDGTPKENTVIIRDGVLIQGLLRKVHVGPSHRSIHQDIGSKYGSKYVKRILTDGPWIISVVLTEQIGFTVGILDTINTYELEKPKSMVEDATYPPLNSALNPSAHKSIMGALRDILDRPGYDEQLEREVVPKVCWRTLLSYGIPARLSLIEEYIRGESSEDIVVTDGIIFTESVTMGILTDETSPLMILMRAKYPNDVANYLLCVNTITDMWLSDKDAITEVDINARERKKMLDTLKLEIRAVGPKLSDPEDEKVREQKINNIVNVTEKLGIELVDLILKNPRPNAIITMTERGAGTKGAVGNVSQIMASAGQQYVMGQRPAPNIDNNTRVLPYYDSDDPTVEARCYITSSFGTGLKPDEFYGLHMGGREGLTDTALKTAETGTIQRGLVKAVESTVVGYPRDLRNTTNAIFSPLYNNAISPAEEMNVNGIYGRTVVAFVDVDSIIRDEIADAEKELDSSYTKMADPTAGDLGVSDAFLAGFVQVSQEDSIPEPSDFPDDGLNIFERTRILGDRATQIDLGALPAIPIPDTVRYPRALDHLYLAEIEYKLGKCPLYIRRPGSTVAKYPYKSDLLVTEDAVIEELERLSPIRVNPLVRRVV